jgi:hypothetical protein
MAAAASTAPLRAPTTALAACVLALVAGCATAPPPVEEMAVARSAVSDAVSAGSAEYAPAELSSAQEKLELGHAAAADRRYDDARRLAEESEVDARLAATTARSRKAQDAVAEVDSGIQALKDEIARGTRPY